MGICRPIANRQLRRFEDGKERQRPDGRAKALSATFDHLPQVRLRGRGMRQVRALRPGEVVVRRRPAIVRDRKAAFETIVRGSAAGVDGLPGVCLIRMRMGELESGNAMSDVFRRVCVADGPASGSKSEASATAASSFNVTSTLGTGISTFAATSQIAFGSFQTATSQSPEPVRKALCWAVSATRRVRIAARQRRPASFPLHPGRSRSSTSVR